MRIKSRLLCECERKSFCSQFIECIDRVFRNFNELSRIHMVISISLIHCYDKVTLQPLLTLKQELNEPFNVIESLFLMREIFKKNKNFHTVRPSHSQWIISICTEFPFQILLCVHRLMFVSLKWMFKFGFVYELVGYEVDEGSRVNGTMHVNRKHDKTHRIYPRYRILFMITLLEQLIQYNSLVHSIRPALLILIYINVYISYTWESWE